MLAVLEPCVGRWCDARTQPLSKFLPPEFLEAVRKRAGVPEGGSTIRIIHRAKAKAAARDARKAVAAEAAAAEETARGGEGAGEGVEKHPSSWSTRNPSSGFFGVDHDEEGPPGRCWRAFLEMPSDDGEFTCHCLGYFVSAAVASQYYDETAQRVNGPQLNLQGDAAAAAQGGESTSIGGDDGSGSGGVSTPSLEGAPLSTRERIEGAATVEGSREPPLPPPLLAAAAPARAISAQGNTKTTSNVSCSLFVVVGRASRRGGWG